MTKPLSFWLLLVAGSGMCLNPLPAHALDSSRSLLQYNCQSWSRQNGLPVNGIRAVTQTRDGYLWLGTQKGLVRFDGLNFTVVSLPNEPGWRIQHVSRLTSSSKGGLWFAVDQGAYGYFDGRGAFVSPPTEWNLPPQNSRMTLETADGTLWFGSQNGLIQLPGASTNSMVVHAQIGDVQSLHVDDRRRVWIGSLNNGLFCSESNRITRFPDDALTNVMIHAVATDRHGQLWLGTTSGLWKYDRNSQRIETGIYTEVRSLLCDRQGVMWAGTSGDGLMRFRDGEVSSLRQTNGLADNYVLTLYEDREGSLWVGTREGLSQISDVKFPIFSSAHGLPADGVHGVCTSTNGGIWAATERGISRFDGRKAVNFDQDAGLASLYVKRVWEARDGDLYLINGNRQVEVFAGGKVVGRHSNGDWPVAMTEDGEGMIASFGGGLFRVNRDRMTPMDVGAAAFYWIRNLSTTPDGALLTASVNGLFHIQNGKVRQWTKDDGLPDLDVMCAIEDNQKTIWVGQASGVSRIRDGKVKFIRDELTACAINAIVPDQQGNFWLASTRGIIRVTVRSLNAVADGRMSSLEGVLHDGLESIKTIDSREVEFVGCRSRDGAIWFPSPQGVVRIEPDRIATNPVAPSVLIQKVVVNGVEAALGKPFMAQPGKGELAFQYTALSYISPQKLRFRYKLEGYDADWIEAGTQRSALYANLRPRSYEFLVQACNVDGVWNEAGDSFSVVLPPHYYQTGLFRTLAGGLVALLLFGIYLWRTGHLRRQEKKLQAANELLENRIRKRTQELADQRNLLRTLIDHLPDEVFVKDTQGRVIVNNLAHARTLGFANPELTVGKTDFDCFPAEQAEAMRRSELRMLDSGHDYNGEESLNLAGGQTRWYRTTKVPLRDGQGQIIGLAGINRDITERKKAEAQLEDLHRQLLATSRQAGMAEVATSVLHNVGNVLNSVNVSASIVEEQVRNSALERFQRVLGLLKENSGDLARFLTEDEKGTKILPYMEALFKTMNREKARVQEEIESLNKNVEHIKKIVSMQQSYARVAGLVELVAPAELMEDALRMHEAAFHRHGIKLVRDFQEMSRMSVDRHKVIQILVNLLGNAKYACDANDASHRVVRVSVKAIAGDRVRFQVIDNGMGIPAENLTRIFSHGFTTRKNGHGFGLHSGALAAQEMEGTLTVESEGPGKGATFTLELPRETRSTPKSIRHSMEPVAMPACR